MKQFYLKLFSAAATSLALFSSISQAADYPKKPIELIVGYGAGGGVDMCFRTMANEISKALDNSMIVINRPGAGSSLSIGHLVRQKPEGYVIGTLATGAVLNQFFIDDIEYDVLEDLEPIGMVALFQAGLVVRNDGSYKSIHDVINYAKENPGMAYSTAGIGTPQHLTMERLAEIAGVDFVHVPYNNGPEAILALQRGDVDFMSQTAEWVPYVRDGSLKALAVFTEQRMEGFEDVPTLIEEDFDIIAPSMLGVVGPKGIPSEKVKVLQNAFQQALNTEDVINCANQFGWKVDFKTAEQFGKHIKETVEDWGEITTEISKTTN